MDLPLYEFSFVEIYWIMNNCFWEKYFKQNNFKNIYEYCKILLYICDTHNRLLYVSIMTHINTASTLMSFI